MKGNKVFATYGQNLEKNEKQEPKPKKKSKWLNIVLSMAFIGVLGFGGYQLYYALQPVPWYVQLYSKACSLLIFW